MASRAIDRFWEVVGARSTRWVTISIVHATRFAEVWGCKITPRSPYLAKSNVYSDLRAAALFEWDAPEQYKVTLTEQDISGGHFVEKGSAFSCKGTTIGPAAGSGYGDVLIRFYS